MSLDSAANKIIQALRPTANELNTMIGAGIIFGTVETLKPLSIRIDARKVIPEDFIVLSPFCIRAEFDNYRPTYPRAGGSGYPQFASHDHDFHVGLWRGLEVGDEVAITMSSDKQMYYVHHRLNMVFGDMGG